MKQIRKMIIGLAIMLLGINVEIHGGFIENTSIFIVGGLLSIIGLFIVLFNNHGDDGHD